MAFEAFRVHRVLDLPGRRIEALCFWEKQLLVAIKDGSLLFVQPSTTGPHEPWQVTKTFRGLDRKAMTQVQPIASRPLLLALTDDGVNLHTLPGMQLKFQAMGTRAATCFAWHEPSQILAVAVRRKVLLLTLSGSDLVDKGEQLVPEPPVCMMWTGSGTLFVGCKYKYYMVTLAAAGAGGGSNAVVDLGSPGPDMTPCMCMAAGGEVLLGCNASATFFTADGKPSKKPPVAFSKPLHGLSCAEHYALGLVEGGAEACSLFRINAERVTQELAAGSVPTTITAPHPDDSSHFIALGGDLLSLMSSSPEPGVVLRLVPIPLQDQAMALAGQGDFHSALALVGMLPDDKPTRQGQGQGEGQAEAAAEAEGKQGAEAGASAVLQKALTSAQGGARPGVDDSSARTAAAAGASTRLEKGGEPAITDAAGEGITAGDGASAGGVDGTPASASVSAVQQPGQGGTGKDGARPVGRRELEQRLRLMYGHHLFAGGEYDEGMAQIALCSGTDALLYLRLFPSLVSERNRPLLPTSAHGVTLPQVSEPEGKARPAAVATLLPYVLSHRSRALARLGEVSGTRGSGSAGATAEAGAEGAIGVAVDGAEKQEADGRVGGAEAQAVAPEQQLLSIIDTAIVRIMVDMPDTGELLRFVQKPNNIDLGDAVQVLSQHGMYAELAALYRCNGRHVEGLELLRRVSQEPQCLDVAPRGAAADLPGLPGVWAAVRYLVSLSEADIPLIRKHSTWIFRADPEAGLQAFLQMRPPLSPALVLSILADCSADLRAMYLEAALHMGLALPQEYHNELLLMYLQELSDQEAASKAAAAAAATVAAAEASTATVAVGSGAGGTATAAAAAGGATKAEGPGKGEARVSDKGPKVDTKGAGPQSKAAAAVSAKTKAKGVGAASGEKALAQNGGAGSGAGGSAGAVSGGLMGLASQLHMRLRKGFDHTSDAMQPGAAEKGAAGSGAGGSNKAGSSTSGGSPPSEWSPTARHPGDSLFSGGVGASPHLNSDSNHSGDDPTSALRLMWQSDLYRRVRDLALTSPYIDPEYILQRLAPGQTPEIRALLLERLSRYKEALQLLVQGHGDLALAESMCDRVYSQQLQQQQQQQQLATQPLQARQALQRLALQQPSDIYLVLVDCVLEMHSRTAAKHDEMKQPQQQQQKGQTDKQAGVKPGAASSSAPVPPASSSESSSSPVKNAPATASELAGATGAASADRDTSSLASAGGAWEAEPPWQGLAWVLSRKRHRVSAPELLARLPDDVPLAAMLPLVESMLRNGIEERRSLEVERQLRRADNLSAHAECVMERRRHVVHTQQRACSICFRRIGNTVVVVYPDHSVAHYLCHSNLQGGA